MNERSRALAAGLGLMTTALFAWGLFGQEEPPSLCVNGHPAHRSAHVTYGGLPPREGYVRDHIVPLCLAGPDVPRNIQYQAYADGHTKDEREWRACEEYCRNPSPTLLKELQSEFKPATGFRTSP